MLFVFCVFCVFCVLCAPTLHCNPSTGGTTAHLALEAGLVCTVNNENTSCIDFFARPCCLYSVCSVCSVFPVRALRTQRIQAAWTSLQDRTGLRGLLVPPPTSLAQHLLVVRGIALTGTVLLADPFLPVVRAAQLFAKIHFPQPHSFGCSLNQWLSFNSSDSFGESLD